MKKRVRKYSLNEIHEYMLEYVSEDRALELLILPLKEFKDENVIDLYNNNESDYSPEIMDKLKRMFEKK